MTVNHKLITESFSILRDALSIYIGRELKAEFGEQWWGQAVFETLKAERRHGLPTKGAMEQLVRRLDIANCLDLFDSHWQGVFRRRLSIEHRNWAKELLSVRNKNAHPGADDFTDNDTWRALDTMSRLCEQINPESAEKIRNMLREFWYGTEYGRPPLTDEPPTPSPQKQKRLGILDATPDISLPCWRDVMRPHTDVARGEYRNAEFAADLAQVSRGEGSFEYRDPKEFFARTCVTEGMEGLLREALRRVTGKSGGGEPVIQLKTAFGGGKTHSILALYHMMNGKVSPDKIPSLQKILQEERVATMPKVNVAVLVGTAMDPNVSKRPNNMPGITINTFWGDMAAQLAYSAGKPKLYELIKESDKNGKSPGSAKFKELFDAVGPCLVLIDELVAYARNLPKTEGIPAGTLDSFISFIQAVTEGARASKNSLVVVSIPESEMEAGGDTGHEVLRTLDHVFSRMQSIWKPVTAEEGFEVVRRRLFNECDDEKASIREEVCERFYKMYQQSASEFPVETRDIDYLNRMIACYPIHPEVFDRLYQDWATLEKFQRTRGVLRLMAAVIKELWMNSDSSLMIMPGSLPLSLSDVRNELTRNLDETWSPILDTEVDGKNSIPYQKDQSIERYGISMVARRVARTVLLGSAPSVKGHHLRGIETSKIRLGTVQPGENISIFNDALTTLADSLVYLYKSETGDRYWYDTRPSLIKTAKDRATQIPDSEVMNTIIDRIRYILKSDNSFTNVHTCPTSSYDVPDDQSARLVVLHPSILYKNKDDSDDMAMTAANDYLKNHGNNPRIYRNMLVFVVTDFDRMNSLNEATRLYLAWNSIDKDKEKLTLDTSQTREINNKLAETKKIITERINDTYCRLLVPTKELTTDMKTAEWNVSLLTGGEGTFISKVASKLISNEQIIRKWAPLLLLNELNKPLQGSNDAEGTNKTLWKEATHIAIKELWDCLCKYLYLPRLKDKSVLMDAIKTGLNSPEYFAFASGYEGGRYIGLKYNQPMNYIEESGLLVQLQAAKQQIATEESEKAQKTSETPIEDTAISGDNCSLNNNTPNQSTPPLTPTPPRYTRFHMSTNIALGRHSRDIDQIFDEVISHLKEDSDIEITLEVQVTSKNSFSTDKVNTVKENCKTLKVNTSDFGE